MEVALIQLFVLLSTALLWQDVGAHPFVFFQPGVIASEAPLDVYLGAGQPQWIELTKEQTSNVSLYEMHVVVTPAVCRENSTKRICFHIHRKNNSIDSANGVGEHLDGECHKGEERKRFKYSNFTLIHPGELLVLRIAMCPDPDNGILVDNPPEVGASCNVTSPDCLCVNACLPMWVAVRIDAMYSHTYENCTDCTDESYVVLDTVPEETLLLSLHNATNTTQFQSCSQSNWALEHVGTIVASTVALLLLGVVVALLGGITGYWRRGKEKKKKTLPPEAHTSPPSLQEQEQQEEEAMREPPTFSRPAGEGEEEAEVPAYIKGSYEDLDVIMSDELMQNSTQVLVRPPPVIYGSSVSSSTQPVCMTYSQVQHTLTAAKGYEVPVTRSDFWQPTPVESEIITYMSRKKTTLIQQDKIKLLEKLGEGEFGSVFRGLWHKDEGGVTSVAVKMARDGKSAIDRTKLLQEAAIMGQFSHENVIMLMGVVKNKESVMIVTEFLSNGDLRLHLRNTDMEATFTPKVLDGLPVKLLHFGNQIAQGMKYLSQKAFVHRDLAARNILLDKDYICKIADFGLSRDLAEGEYYRSRGGKIPVKWTAPEALHYRRYSTSSDVWSYGMVLFEIWSLGHKPFEDMSISQVANLPNNGYCQPPPPGCPRQVYQLMVECWNPDADKRPSFSSIVDYLTQPDNTLLHWSEADKTRSPSCTVLGAELGAGRTLYENLQQRHSACADRKAERKAKANTLDEDTMLGH